MRLAVIPARGGSKRIPRKNIRAFCGRPMIGWSIKAALDSGCFDHVIVSTDDAEIADVARDAGAAVPFMRPAELADDITPTLPVIRHAIAAVAPDLGKAELVCCLYATAPFLRPEDLRQGLGLLERGGCDYVMSIAAFPAPIQRALRRDEAGHLAMFQPEHLLTRSQDLEAAWHDAGQFYWGRAAAWVAGTPLLGPETLGMILPRDRVQDIDTPEDWRLAERLFTAMAAPS